MKNKLQKLIVDLDARKSKALKNEITFNANNSYADSKFHKGLRRAFDYSIGKLRQILNEETAKDLKKCKCDKLGKPCKLHGG